MMMQLHSELDRIEDLRNSARDEAEQVVREFFNQAVALAGGNIDALPAALEIIAAAVGERLADVTTQAFQVGAGFAEERKRVV